MTTDPWAEGTFAGLAAARQRRVAAWTPHERLAWLEAVVLDAHDRGLLVPLRARRQEEALAEWARGSEDGS